MARLLARHRHGSTAGDEEFKLWHKSAAKKGFLVTIAVHSSSHFASECVIACSFRDKAGGVFQSASDFRDSAVQQRQKQVKAARALSLRVKLSGKACRAGKLLSVLV